MKDNAMTSLEDLKEDALKHYDKVSSRVCTYYSDISKAIEFYYDRMIEIRDGKESSIINNNNILFEISRTSDGIEIKRTNTVDLMDDQITIKPSKSNTIEIK